MNRQAITILLLISIFGSCIQRLKQEENKEIFEIPVIVQEQTKIQLISLTLTSLMMFGLDFMASTNSPIL